ncbi:UDP-GlcNAc:undecaprenyl-phosphate GlcNAc-1-phosphate transferase [Aeromicrobium choanae]|uniref:UDP-GlcNAc:undecaprenyl-phosphate GlcNAc-1-phosphate transferase n=1 Tax=Aeromicrobium choanae TaxID=1736691 RepID=A0A1T4Z5D9_9ACTN|nr:UDP-GlcNAc:undecaprenyl-phosphate GlcNAc-1-phosphate transferase [Aeromicrobium choanae]
MEPVREYLVIFGVAIGVAYLLSSIARQSAQQLGAVAQVRDRDVHAIPTPYFGGPAMLGGLIAAYLTATHLPFLSGGDPSLFADVRAVLVGACVICLVGVIDDLFELDALSKFAGQVLAGVITVAMGLHFVYLPLPNTYLGLDQAQAMILTVFLIVATANAMNFVDGLDGLAAGMAAIGSIAFFVYAFVLAVENGETRAVAAAILTIALAGACLGILPHNFFPARMFIGDSGSMLLGFVLACSSISLTGQFPATSLSEGIGGADSSLLPAAILPLVLPFAVLTVPFLDMGLAVLRRTRAGRSPFSPDKMHIHHRLLEIGHSHRRAVLLMYAAAALVAFGVVAIGLFSGWQLFVAIALLTALVTAAIFLLPRLESKVWS